MGIANVVTKGENVFGMIFWCAAVIGGFAVVTKMLVMLAKDEEEPDLEMATVALRMLLAYMTCIVSVAEIYGYHSSYLHSHRRRWH